MWAPSKVIIGLSSEEVLFAAETANCLARSEVALTKACSARGFLRRGASSWDSFWGRFLTMGRVEDMLTLERNSNDIFGCFFGDFFFLLYNFLKTEKFRIFIF